MMRVYSVASAEPTPRSRVRKRRREFPSSSESVSEPLILLLACTSSMPPSECGRTTQDDSAGWEDDCDATSTASPYRKTPRDEPADSVPDSEDDNDGEDEDTIDDDECDDDDREDEERHEEEAVDVEAKDSEDPAEWPKAAAGGVDDDMRDDEEGCTCELEQRPGAAGAWGWEVACCTPRPRLASGSAAEVRPRAPTAPALLSWLLVLMLVLLVVAPGKGGGRSCGVNGASRVSHTRTKCGDPKRVPSPVAGVHGVRARALDRPRALEEGTPEPVWLVPYANMPPRPALRSGEEWRSASELAADMAPVVV